MRKRYFIGDTVHSIIRDVIFTSSFFPSGVLRGCSDGGGGQGFWGRDPNDLRPLPVGRGGLSADAGDNRGVPTGRGLPRHHRPLAGRVVGVASSSSVAMVWLVPAMVSEFIRQVLYSKPGYVVSDALYSNFQK